MAWACAALMLVGHGHLGNRTGMYSFITLIAFVYCVWAVVGSGANRIAAAEVRIKLSELCYRGVAVDAVEDKKHIDLSAESLILVCTAGSPVTQMSDLHKEVAIFSAHRNTPLVIAMRNHSRYTRRHQ